MEDPNIALSNHDDWFNLVMAHRQAEALGVGGLCRQVAKSKTVPPTAEEFNQEWGGLVPHAIY